MIYGVCTNQPANCAKARSRELVGMPRPDTRCPEPGCGKPLLPAPGRSTRSAWRSLPLIAAGVIGLSVAGGAIYVLTRPDQNDTPSQPPAPYSKLEDKHSTPKNSTPEKSTPKNSTPENSTPKNSTTQPHVGAQPAPPVETQPPSHRPMRELPRSAGQSCEEIARTWTPEDPRLSTCDGLVQDECRRIRRCLKINDPTSGPGTTKDSAR